MLAQTLVRIWGKVSQIRKLEYLISILLPNILENQPLVNEIIFNKKNPNEISPKTANFG